jgi:hypothetical protein
MLSWRDVGWLAGVCENDDTIVVFGWFALLFEQPPGYRVFGLSVRGFPQFFHTNIGECIKIGHHGDIPIYL